MILGVPNYGLGITALNEDTSTLVTLGVCGMTTDGHTVQGWSTRLPGPQPRPGTHYHRSLSLSWEEFERAAEGKQLG